MDAKNLQIKDEASFCIFCRRKLTNIDNSAKQMCKSCVDELCCPICYVLPTQPHERICSLAKCKYCYSPLNLCNCSDFEPDDWEGIENSKELDLCIKNDWFLVWKKSIGWVPCAQSIEGSIPDYHRARIKIKIDSQAARFDRYIID